MIDRRTLMLTGAAALTASAAVRAQSAPASAQNAEPTRDQRIAKAASEHRLRLDFSNGRFSGPAWNWLVDKGRQAHFFLLGEQHGIAENPKLVAQLFEALVPAGYSRLAIEVSPPMATELDKAAGEGLAGIRRMYADPASRVVFYGMREEAEMIAAVRRAVPDKAPILWGTDYELAADRRLIRLLKARTKPPAAAAALDALNRASAESWSRYEATHNPQFIFSFAGDPALVKALRSAWPNVDPASALILETLEETLAINREFVAGNSYESNRRRADLQRRNWLRLWRAEKAAGRTPRVFCKYGASHMVRGRNDSEVFDLGTLIHELAASEGHDAFHLLVLNGAGTQTAIFDPTSFTYKPGSPDGYGQGLEPIVGQAWTNSFTLFDLAPLRPLLGASKTAIDPDLMRVVHGFDGLLVLSGSTPSANL